MNDLKNDKTIIVIASCTSCGVQQTVVFGKSRKPKCCKCKSGELAIIEYTKPAGFVRCLGNCDENGKHNHIHTDESN